MLMNDWATLWRELAREDVMASAAGEEHMVSRWRGLAERLDAGDRTDDDPLRDFVLSRLRSEETVLDIGAGIGRWTIPLAVHAGHVTAVEPVAAMREVLADRIAARQLRNVSIVAAPWGEAEVGVHDVAIAVHSTYTSPDLLAFVARMDAHARRGCYLVLRLPAHDGVMGELSERLRGRWHDSPNFIVAYNLLLAAGYRPNVLVEPTAARAWEDDSMEAALARARRHLRLEDERHDAEIRAVLEQRLTGTGGRLRWPDEMRSALAWWEKERP